MKCPRCATENADVSEACGRCGWDLGALAPATLLAGRYEIVDLLGRGGLGRVYRARDRMLDEIVALKVMHPEAARSADLTRRFLSEIKLARKVRHRNVCPIHEYGEEGAIRFVAMELVDGVDLARTLREKGPLPPREAFEVAIQVAKGLEAIHEAGVIHRDLKTANIIRDHGGVIRLLDFGIAKRTSPHGTLALTAEQKVVGTPEYMSPEQIRGEEIDPRSDIYALGVVLFEIFTGVAPFRGRNALDTLLKQVNDPPPLEGDVAARIPRSLLSVLRKALAKDPRGRYASAGDLLEALRTARAAAYPDSVVTPPPQPVLEAVPEPPPATRTTVLPKPSLASSPSAEAARRSAREDAAAAALDPDRTYIELTPLRPGASGQPMDPGPVAPFAERPAAPQTMVARAGSAGRWRWVLALAALLAGALAVRGWLLRSGPDPSPSPTPEPSVAALATPMPEAPPTAPPPSAAPLAMSSPSPAPSPSPTGAVFIAAPTPEPTPSDGASLLDEQAAAEAWPDLAEPSPTSSPSVAPTATPRPRARRWAVPVAPTPAPTPEPSPTPPALLALNARPWAEVEVDGKEVGKTPFEGLPLDPGPRRIRLVHPDYWPLQREVVLEAGRTSRLDIDIQWEAVPRGKGGEAPYRISMDETPSDPYFERGVRQLAAGETREAVLTLEPVVRRLAASGKHRRELARAEFYLGVAYLDLGQEGDARASFLSAIEHDGSLRPSPSAFPAKVTSFFVHVRESTKKK